MAGNEGNDHQGTALIYCRMASTSQDAPALDEQAEACTKLAGSLGYAVGRITKEIASGSGEQLWKRPLFAQDWADVEAGKFAAIIVASPDRLTRHLRQARFLAMACDQLGVTLACVEGDIPSISRIAS